MPRKLLQGADVNNQRIINVGSPSSSTDAANKQYVDDNLAGLAWKQPVRVATTANGTLASAYANGSTVDGVTLTTGMRILVKDQTAGAENGIYTVNASGAPTRATDADATAELQNATTYVIAGTVNGDKAFTQTANDPTVGTTSLVFAQVGGSGTYTATAPLLVTGSVLSINAIGNGLIGDGTSLRVDPAVVARKYAVNCAATTTTTVTHNLGTLDVDVTVVLVSTGEVVDADILITGTNTLTVTFPSAPSAGQYRIVVMG